MHFLITSAPSSGAVFEAKEPPNVPMAVLKALVITIWF
jgi:hypothetical protein